MKTTWVLVAENSRARLFNWESREVLHAIKTFFHPESRLHEQDLVNDKPGRVFNSAGDGRHAQQPPTSAKQYEAQVFAKELVAMLDKAVATMRLSILLSWPRHSFLVSCVRRCLLHSRRWCCRR